MTFLSIVLRDFRAAFWMEHLNVRTKILIRTPEDFLASSAYPVIGFKLFEFRKQIADARSHTAIRGIKPSKLIELLLFQLKSINRNNED